MKLDDKNWHKLKSHTTPEIVLKAYNTAILHMSTLNLTAAKLMKKYKAHAGTDVTGFGLLGHASNLAIAQKEKVNLVINRLPIIADMIKLDKTVVNFKLKEGFSAETSGGILMCIAKDKANDFIQEYKSLTGLDTWIVGEVVRGENKAVISSDAEVIEV